MSPPPYDDDETGGIPAAPPAPQPTTQDPISWILNNRTIVLFAVVLLSTGSLSSAYTAVTGGPVAETARETAAEAKATDEKIIEAVEGIRVDVHGIKKQQQQLQIAINGDATEGIPGIKGELKQHQRKLDRLRADGKKRDRRTMKADEKAGIKLPPDYDLARGGDEVWDDPR